MRTHFGRPGRPGSAEATYLGSRFGPCCFQAEDGPCLRTKTLMVHHAACDLYSSDSAKCNEAKCPADDGDDDDDDDDDDDQSEDADEGDDDDHGGRRKHAK
eukprot:TRINITY_DN32651_c0_g1_i1.p3 TRINITY_DN32651_c0_g1~~TRINITY_DN32651_c0_g1_i1.p3  ORF type:complete len:101 (-),score=6.59 TRINITY_DN32651_c0_g1_i1:27-329(-)